MLHQGVKAADLVADHVGFRMAPDEGVFRIDAEGDTDSVDFQIGVDDWEAVTLVEVSSLFSLDYMKRIMRTVSKGTSVTVDFGIALLWEIVDEATQLRVGPGITRLSAWKFGFLPALCGIKRQFYINDVL